MAHVRPIWKIKELTPGFGVFLILLFGIPRFIIVLNANATGNYGLTSVLFLVMWITPFVLLTKSGRMLIGFKKPDRPLWLFYAFFVGVAACVFVFAVGLWLYGETVSNWFVYVSRSYNVPDFGENVPTRFSYFLIFAAVGITFSPVGEELLYRGLIHQCFVSKYGENRASMIDSLAFGITHLAHFGILYIAGGFQFFVFPGLIWVTLMYFAGRLFFISKARSGSIAGAVISHAGFNLAMTGFIFYWILN